ncbi:hypothetical protein BGW80DRAFT_1254722 [Lactifluus volemus]|nr:hypothetical protein BGW80DRAFT_1254722 [Lactifluus volemus]
MTPPGNTPDLSPTTLEEPISPFDEAVETLISHDVAMALEEAKREQREMLQTPTPNGPQPGIHPGIGWISNQILPDWKLPNVPDGNGTYPGKKLPYKLLPIMSDQFLFAEDKKHSPLVDAALENLNDPTLKAKAADLVAVHASPTEFNLKEWIFSKIHGGRNPHDVKHSVSGADARTMTQNSVTSCDLSLHPTRCPLHLEASDANKGVMSHSYGRFIIPLSQHDSKPEKPHHGDLTVTLGVISEGEQGTRGQDEGVGNTVGKRMNVLPSPLDALWPQSTSAHI